ncbi:MAG TPA: M56 family metallopeptidase [Candidatus Sulfopaludibacter sp.]|jgi:TonB family protein|nr:M56 family metallopeptidase [Candidatus Sulfopaludibacter sp.]
MTTLELLTQCAWKSSVLLGAGFAASLLLRRRSAALRHSVWVACLAASLALPLAVVKLPRWAVLGRQGTVAVVPSTSVVAAAVSAAEPIPAPVPWNVPLTIWASGTALAGLWFLVGILGTSWMVRRAAPGGDAADLARSLGIRRRVRLLHSDAAPMPLTWGVMRPVVVLPRTAVDWPASRLHAVLLHELVHVRRLDLLAQAIGQAVCCLYWFHPLAWLAARQLRIEREQACDDAVLALGIPAPEYAGHLMDMVRAMADRTAWNQSVAMAEASGLELRVRALLDRKRDRRPLNRWKAAAIATVGVAMLLPMGALSETPVPPQARGSLTGTVKDPSGAVIPGCTVVAHAGDGNSEETATTGAVGQYTFNSIPSGRYTVTVEARGFVIFRAPVVVPAGSAAQLNANLTLGSVSQAVEVRGSKTAPVVPPAPGPKRIRVGGNVQQTKLVRQPRPVYPPELQQLGVEGVVSMRAIISKEGVPTNIQVLSTGVDERLIAPALDSVKLWRYQPMLLNGEPVETLTTIDVTFKLGQ